MFEDICNKLVSAHSFMTSICFDCNRGKHERCIFLILQVNVPRFYLKVGWYNNLKHIYSLYYSYLSPIYGLNMPLRRQQQPIHQWGSVTFVIVIKLFITSLILKSHYDCLNRGSFMYVHKNNQIDFNFVIQYSLWFTFWNFPPISHWLD